MEPFKPSYPTTKFASFWKVRNTGTESENGVFQLSNRLFGESWKDSFSLKQELPFLVTVINLHSYILFFPFRIKYCSEQDSFVISSSIIRKVVCFLVHVMIIASIGLWMYPNLATFVKMRMTVRILFFISSQISTVFGMAFLFKIAWFDKTSIVELCNLMYTPQRRKFSSRKYRLTKLLVCCFCMSFFGLLWAQGVFTAGRKRVAALTYYRVVSLFSPIFDFLGAHPIDWLADNLGTYPLIYIGLFSFSWFCAYAAISTNIFLVLSLTLSWYVSNVLKDNSVIQLEKTPMEVTLEYEEVKQVTKKAQDIFSNFIICFNFMGMAIFSHLPELLLTPGTENLNNWIIYTNLASTAVSFYFALQVNEKVQSGIRKYIQCKHIALPQNSLDHDIATTQRLLLLALRQDVEAVPIGVSCKFFTITGHFVGSSIGIIVTYAIIVLQMQS